MEILWVQIQTPVKQTLQQSETDKKKKETIFSLV